MIFTANWGIFPVYLDLGGFAGANASHINTGSAGVEPVIQSVHDRVQSVVIQDPAAPIRSSTTSSFRMCWKNPGISPVCSRTCTCSGGLGQKLLRHHNNQFYQYFWVDRTLKQSLTGR